MTVQNDNNNKDTFGVALGEIRSDVKHLITSINQSRTDLKEHRNEIRDALQTQDHRIQRIEQFQWKLTGIITIIAFVVPLGLSLLVKVL